MDDYGIRPEWREAWQKLDCALTGYQSYGADLSVHLLAGWMRERFDNAHGHFFVDNRCMDCVESGLESDDPRHNFTDADWERVARLKLNGETK